MEFALRLILDCKNSPYNNNMSAKRRYPCFSYLSLTVYWYVAVLQVLVPFILVSCTLQAVHVISRVPIHGLFLLIMLMSDCMALVR